MPFSRPLVSRPFRPLWTAAITATLLAGVAGGATDLTALLRAVAGNARFEPPMRADVRFETPRADGTTRTSSLVLYGRDRTVRVETPDGGRALVKPGKSVLRPPGEAPRTVREHVVGGSAFLLEDLAPFTAGNLRVPQVSDESDDRVVVMGEPSGKSPYVLLVHTIPRDRPVIAASKFYRGEVNYLSKMIRVEETVEVGGRWRPRVVVLQDLTPGGDTTTITFDWHEQPDLPASAFTPRGLGADVPRTTP